MGRSTLIGSVCGKIWGTTKCLFTDSISEVHYLEIVQGGFCSKHKHVKKWNRFVVLSGTLQIIIYKDNNEDVTTLTKGMITDVQPEIYHRFKALEPTTLIPLILIEWRIKVVESMKTQN
jgi:mannose-6-phosphate isomerase-like protein (cupin superfamily)